MEVRLFLFTPQNELVRKRAGEIYFRHTFKERWSFTKMDILGKLLGGIPRVKIMRLFLLNADEPFGIDDIVERSRLQRAIARKVVTGLLAMCFIQKKSFIQEFEDSKGRITKKRIQGWILATDFPYIAELKQLLVEGEFFKHSELAKRFKPAGRVQLLVVSGIFIQDSETKLDLLIVGDNLRKNFLQKTISVLESELGKELRYAVFDTADFKYRMAMYDKLLRDVFDYPHEKLVIGKEFSTLTLPN